MGSAEIEIDPQLEAFVPDTVRSIRKFYPDVTITMDAGVAILVSEGRKPEMLRRVFAAALVNEKLLQQGQTERGQLWDLLLA